MLLRALSLRDYVKSEHSERSTVQRAALKNPRSESEGSKIGRQRDQTLREGFGHRPAEARDSYFRHPDINFSGFVAVAELDRETISGLTRAADERMSVMRRAVGKQRDTFLVACRCATLPRWVRISATAWQLGAPTASSAPS
jgi:hypothetical protein